MRLWETVRSFRGDGAHWNALLYEQPLWRHLVGRSAAWIWRHSPRCLVAHHGEPWKMAYELYMAALPRRGRREIEMVHLRARPGRGEDIEPHLPPWRSDY